jgi:hypothetical protein
MVRLVPSIVALCMILAGFPGLSGAAEPPSSRYRSKDGEWGLLLVGRGLPAESLMLASPTFGPQSDYYGGYTKTCAVAGIRCKAFWGFKWSISQSLDIGHGWQVGETRFELLDVADRGGETILSIRASSPEGDYSYKYSSRSGLVEMSFILPLGAPPKPVTTFELVGGLGLSLE